MISIQLPAELLTVAMFLIVATMFSIVLSRAQLNVLNCRVAEVKVIGCIKISTFLNSEIHFENGWSQSFTPQKCPMKIKQESTPLFLNFSLRTCNWK